MSKLYMYKACDILSLGNSPPYQNYIPDDVVPPLPIAQQQQTENFEADIVTDIRTMKISEAGLTTDATTFHSKVMSRWKPDFPHEC